MPDKNTFETAEYMRKVAEQAMSVMRWWSLAMDEEGYMSVVVTEIRIQSPTKTGQDYRVVAKGTDGQGRPLVAFGNGSDVQSALASLKARAESQGMPWKDDKPWKPEG